MSSAVDLDTTTEPSEVSLGQIRRSYALRSLFFVLIVALLVSAMLGYLGYRNRTLRHTVDAVHTTVTYGQFTRRGITTPVHIEIESDTGFDGDVTIALNDDYLERLSIRNLSPQPDQEASAEGNTEWTFQKPDANTISFDIDAEIDGSAVPGWVDATLAIGINDQLTDAYTFRTWIWP